MERTINKKKLHLKPEEKRHVTKTINKGFSLKDVDRWHQMRFGKKLANRHSTD